MMGHSSEMFGEKQTIVDNLKVFVSEMFVILKSETYSFKKHVNRSLQGINYLCSHLDAWQIILISSLVTCAILWFRSLYLEHRFNPKNIFQNIVRASRRLPFLKSYVNKKLEKVQQVVEEGLNKGLKGKIFLKKIPAEGWTQDIILKEIESYQSYGDYAWDEGKVSGAVYHGNDDNLKELITNVYSQTAYHNPLHPDVFPVIRIMEAEIVRMTCTLFHGDEHTCGTVASGGSESIFLACKAYRDYARFEKGIRNPNMVIPESAHAAFDKAAQILNIELRHVPTVFETSKVNLKSMKGKIDSSTCMIVGSAPSFPHGAVDPIEEIAKLGKRYKVPVHVDCCLGGFLVPFMQQAGFQLSSSFDFSVPGVTSISADTHKYAYAPKGTSVIMYRDKSYHHYQYSTQPNWPGGIYGTSTIAGSRSGGLIATCWATLIYHGQDFYVDATKKIISVSKYMEEKIKDINGLMVYGQPEVSVIAIGSLYFDIYCLSDALSHRGWSLNSLQFPSGFHFCVTLQHTQPGVADKFLKDLRECTKELMDSPNTKADGTAAIYGMSQKISDRSLVGEMVWAFLDACTSTKDVCAKDQ